MGGKEWSMKKLDYSRARGWEKNEKKSVAWYVSYIIFMMTVLYLSYSCVYDAPNKTLIGCIFLFIFSDLEKDLEKYYGGLSGLVRIPLLAVKHGGRIIGAGLFISSFLLIMLS